MKTYKEMTEAVLAQAEIRKNRRARRVRIVTSVAAAICLICTAVFVLNGPDAERGTKQAGSREPRLLLICSAAEYAQQEKMVEGVVAPLRFMIRVRDIRGVDSEEELNRITAEEAAFKDSIWAGETGVQGERSATRWGSDNTIVSLICNEFLYIAVSDYDQVQDMSVCTTQTGCATVVPYPYEKFGEDRSVTQVDTGIHINWSLSDETVNRIDADPDMKLSEIRDTVAVTVDFKDGTRETVTIDLSVDDEGQIYVTHRGIVVSK